MLLDLLKIFKLFFGSLFCLHKKMFLISEPNHPNLGDQAQLMCTEKWVNENFPDYKLLNVGHICLPFNSSIKNALINRMILRYIVLKLFIRKTDIILGHSGYFFIDHHAGWFSFEFMLNHFPHNKMIILPQTINFYAPVVIERVRKAFSNRPNLTLLCRDQVSYASAQRLFSRTKLLLYPDIVTSLIGTRQYCLLRDGILFCMRDDIEAFYSIEDISSLMARFGEVRKEKIDTTVKVTPREMIRNRDHIINDMIAKFATFKVVITDRYHGTIFAAIAGTPVIVINSADHKLSSGVNWFPYDIYGINVQFALNLDDAYERANVILHSSQSLYTNPPYFKENYWDKLKSLIV